MDQYGSADFYRTLSITDPTELYQAVHPGIKIESWYVKAEGPCPIAGLVTW